MNYNYLFVCFVDKVSKFKLRQNSFSTTNQLEDCASSYTGSSRSSSHERIQRGELCILLL